MRKSALYLLLFSLMALPMVFLAGCDDDDDPTTTTIAGKPFVSAFAGRGGPMSKVADDLVMAAVAVTNFSRMPGVTMNGQELFVEPEFSYYGGGMGFMGEFTPGMNNQVTMEVHFGEGSEPGVATITLPGENEEVGETDLNLNQNQAIEVAWTTAEGADKYVVNGYVEVEYIDQEDNYQTKYTRFSFFTADTTATLAADLIWPAAADVQFIDDLWGDIDVIAVSGPTDPGDAGNVTGSCNGVLVSYGRGLDWDLDFAEVPSGAEDDRGETYPSWPIILRDHALSQK